MTPDIDQVVAVDPEQEIVTHAEMVAHCRIDQINDEFLEDPMINLYRRAAIQRASIICNCVFTPCHVSVWAAPSDNCIILPVSEAQWVESIEVMKSRRDERYAILEPDNYELTDRDHLHPTKCIPDIFSGEVLRITYRADFPASRSLPHDDVRLGILMLAAHFYNNRETSAPLVIHEIPEGAMDLLWPHRIHRYF